LALGTKINPGSNIHGDNDLRTARTGGMQDIDLPEPKIVEKNKFQCPVCSKVFGSKEDYISHALARHQPVAVEATAASGTSMDEALIRRFHRRHSHRTQIYNLLT